jgi:hypothetical protein
MSLLLAAPQAQLGDFEGWLSPILLLLFLDAPTYTNVRKVVAFFYGNGASAAMCSQAFRAFNFITTEFVIHEIYNFYYLWQRFLYDRHIALYYNIRVKEYLFLNGRLMDPLERAPAPSVEPFGIAGTGFATIIHLTLQHVRDTYGSYYR